MLNTPKIVMIGAGRVASSLALAFREKGLVILQVYNRTPSKGKRLAIRTGAAYTCDLNEISPLADLYIIAVSDDAVAGISERINTGDRLVVHTSGSLPMEVLGKASPNTGVFYPLATFPGRGKRNFSRIPVCIEANSVNNLALIERTASLISGQVVSMNSENRLRLHLAAVFANNFTNFMASVAADLLKEAGAGPEILGTLIRQTGRNMLKQDPFLYQTGPAYRNDTSVMKKHLDMLSAFPEYQNIYRQVSAGIQKMKKRYG